MQTKDADAGVANGKAPSTQPVASIFTSLFGFDANSDDEEGSEIEAEAASPEIPNQGDVHVDHP